MQTHAPSHLLELLDWKRRVFELYREIRSDADPARAWQRWRDVRDELFASHPQSPLPPEERAPFRSLAYFDHDPAAHVVATVGKADPAAYDIQTSSGGTYRFTRCASAEFELYGQTLSLDLYWLEGYGGGVFLPFTDTTSGATTYGAGRYLLDTAKGADLGMAGDRLVLDFNFAYKPILRVRPAVGVPARSSAESPVGRRLRRRAIRRPASLKSRLSPRTKQTPSGRRMFSWR